MNIETKEAFIEVLDKKISENEDPKNDTFFCLNSFGLKTYKGFRVFEVLIIPEGFVYFDKYLNFFYE